MVMRTESKMTDFSQVQSSIFIYKSIDEVCCLNCLSNRKWRYKVTLDNYFNICHFIFTFNLTSNKIKVYHLRRKN